jgi:transcriptional regulator with XRE-family HTH domain
LRREEVAMLAGISTEYYVRLERGRDRRPSQQVMDALARVLGLDEESRSYLAALAGVAAPVRATDQHVSPAIQALVDAAPGPAFVLGRFMDVLAANAPARQLQGDMGNVVRHVFLDAGARAMFPDWEIVAAECVASLRGSVSGHRDDPRLTQLVGELSLKSAEFRAMWARHEVRAKSSGSKRIVAPEIGEIAIHWEALEVTSAPGQILVTYYAEPGSESEHRLAQLADYLRHSRH